MIINEVQPELNLANEDTVFIQEIQNRITEYGQIPYSVPQQVIVNAIKQTMQAFIRLGYTQAITNKFASVSRAEIKKNANDNNLKFNQLGITTYLPLFVTNVWEVYEVGNDRHTMIGTQNSDDFGFDYGYSSTYGGGWGSAYGYGNYGINQQLYAYEKVSRMMLSNAIVSVFGRGLSHRYTAVTGELVINENIEAINGIVIQGDIAAPVQGMYNDDLFVRHVLATCKKSLRRILGSHTTTLVGETTINVDDLCDNIEDAREIEEQLKAGGGLGHIIMKM